MSIVDVHLENGLARRTVSHPPVHTASAGIRTGLPDAAIKGQGSEDTILKCAGRPSIAGGNVRATSGAFEARSRRSRIRAARHK